MSSFIQPPDFSARPATVATLYAQHSEFVRRVLRVHGVCAWSVEDARARTTAPQAATELDRTATDPGQQHTSPPTPPRSAPIR